MKITLCIEECFCWCMLFLLILIPAGHSWRKLENWKEIQTGVSLNKIFVHNDEMLEGLTKRTSAVQR